MPMDKPDFCGMTVNERLFASGLLDDFDRALAQGDTTALAAILVQVDLDPNLAVSLLRNSYECWFCGTGIVKSQTDALRLVIERLWGHDEDRPSQEIYAHFLCAQTRMAGAKMSLERDTFVPDLSED